MKVHIAFDLTDTPTGGGNQFLKALRAHMRSSDAYTEYFHDADVIIVNGHQLGPYLFPLFAAKRVRPDLVVLHRVDGPMETVRGRADNYILDEAIILFNRYFADGTIFQSKWSRDLCLARGMDVRKNQTTINNASDPSVFYASSNRIMSSDKIRIIATSWSNNWYKGFDVFQYLDQSLDFSKFQFTFIGNSPVNFRNIKHLAPLPSGELADELRSHDIFLQASHLEACSNSLIEAMNCGLFPVARNNSSHPEIVSGIGILYEGTEDVIAALNMAVERCLKNSLGKNEKITMPRSGRAYLDFAAGVLSSPVARPNVFETLFTWLVWKMARRPVIFFWLRVLIQKLRY